MKQNAVTLVAQISDEHVNRLKDLLTANKTAYTNALSTLGTVHYARWVVIDKHTLDSGEVFSAQLVFSSNFDGDPGQHIKDLAAKIGAIINEIYSLANGYNSNDPVGYLSSIRTKEAAFYQGSPGRTLGIIAQEKELHRELLDNIRSRNWGSMSAIQVHKALKEAILTKPEFAWAKNNIPFPRIKYVQLSLAILVIVLLLPIILPWVIWLQIFHENRDVPLGKTPNEIDPVHIEKMELDEDFHFQNQFSQVIDMKPGIMRLVTLNSFYAFARVLIKTLFVKGKLMDIPTIHFARWVQINNKKRMLFFSNFDGSWTQYLGDFIDKSGWGLTAIFSNAKYFPKSFMLISKGAYNQREFLAWARFTQIKTHIWYAADVTQSIKNINCNTLIRNAFPKDLNEEQAKQFLARI